MSEIRGEPPVATLRRVFGKGVDYPLVFRELIQNADDCGARWLALGFSEGLPEAEHRFLRGPGLFAVNDGPLRPKDVLAISSLSMGTKIADAGSVGKFGLGLKSVFKYAEMMFYADFRLDPAKPKDFGVHGEGDAAHFDVLSPWLDQAGRKSRQDWEPFTAADRARLGKKLSDLGVEDGFAVWVPLRQASHNLSASILSVFDEDIDDEKKLIGDELIRAFPLLQHLETISFKDPGQPLVTLKREGETRRHLSNEVEPYEATVRGYLKLSESQKPYPYIFQELLSDSQDFKALKASDAWPKFTRYDDHGDEMQVADPALPHAGVVWQRLPDQSEATLETGLAVFLPLSERKSESLEATGSYRLTLHGYFFPTDDRQGIVGKENSQTATGESQTKGQWNHLLKEQLIAPRILEGLQAITADAEQEEITQLTQALRRAVRDVDIDSASLTSRYQWLSVWNGHGTKWRLLPAGQALLPLEGEHGDKFWAAALKASGDLPLYDPSAPNLLSRNHRWDVCSTRTFLFALNWDELLKDEGSCVWLQKMLKQMTFGDLSDELVQHLRQPVAALMSLSREAGVLLRALLPRHTVSLPSEATETQALLSVSLSVLLLPRGHGGHARLTTEDCKALLQLGNAPEVLATILQLATDTEFLEHRAVIPVGNRRLSPAEVRTLAAAKQIYLSEGRDGGLLEALNHVLPQPLQFVEGRYNRLFGLDASPLVPLSVLQTLEAAETLTGKLADRLSLLSKLLEKLTINQENRRVLRYLLHGQKSRMDDAASLIYDRGDVWGKAGSLAAEASGAYGWNFLKTAFKHLSDMRKEQLGLEAATAETVQPFLRVAGIGFPVSQLTEAEIGQLLLALPWSLIKTLPLLKTERGERVVADSTVYLEGKIKPQGRLAELVEIIPLPKEETLQKKFKDSLGPLTVKDVWHLLKTESPWHEWPMLLQVVDQKAASEVAWLPLRHEDRGISLQGLVFLLDERGLVAEPLLQKLIERSEFYSTAELKVSFREQAFQVKAQKGQKATCLFQPYFSLEEQEKKLLQLLGQSASFASGLSDTWQPDYLKKYMKAFEAAPAGTNLLHELLSLPLLTDVRETLFRGAIQPLHTDQLEKQLRFLSQRLQDHPRSEEVRWTYLQLLAPLRGSLREKLLPELYFPSEHGEVKAAEDLVPYDPDLEPQQVLSQEFSAVLFQQGKQEIGGQETEEAIHGSGYQALLRHVRDRWDDAAVDRPLLGLFLLLLDGSEELRRAARPYLKLDPDVERDAAFEGSVHRQEMDRIRAQIQLIEEDTKVACNLLDEEVKVRFRQEIRTLFTKPVRPSVRNCEYPVLLRVIDPRTWSGEALNQLLLQTLKDLYRYYGEVPEGLEDSFKRGRESEATALRVTQRRLVKAAPQIWKQQLSVAPDSTLGVLLQQMEAADRKFEQAKEMNNHKAQQEAEDQFDRLIMDVQKTLLDSPETCDVLLQGVRHRIEQSQYLPHSVPFELLQNADDALVEWEHLGGDLSGRTVVEVALQGQDFSFRHQGRLINRATLREHDMTALGYDGDLEKMLTLVASSKTGSTVTGKFGLGFKSIYLLGDRPTVLSGSTRFTVLGGVYPKQPEMEELDTLSKRHKLTKDDTLIHLRVNDAATATNVMGRFESLVPVLLAFTRRVEEVVVNGRSYRRHVRQIAGQGIEKLEIASRDGCRLFLRLRAGSATLLLPIGADEFTSLEKSVPRLWCLAPLREESMFPIALGADFPVDPGRARIAADKLSGTLTSWQDELLTLLRQFDEHLPDVARQLNWSSDRYEILSSLWELLALSSSSRDVIGALLWAEAGAYRRWATQEEVVPSGLEGDYATLVNLEGLRALPSTMLGLLKYAPFAQAFTPGKLISMQRAAEIKAVLDLDVSPLTAGEVLKALAPQGKVSVERASLLKHAELQSDDWWRQGQFLNKAGKWCQAGSLATPESKYYGMLPIGRQLSDDYPKEIAATIEKKWPIQLSADETMNYLIDATEKQQEAALEFLGQFNPNSPEVKLLRENTQRRWLSEDKLESGLAWQKLKGQQQVHIKNLLGMDVTLSQPKQPQRKPPEPGALEKIFQWWEQEGERELQRYAKALYADQMPDLSRFDSEDPGSRADWFTLLMLGSFQSIGRQKQNQHAEFLRLCRDQKWMKVFAAEESRPEQWHGVLDSFLARDSSYLEYYYWMDGYLSYYQFGRWLGVYADLLLDLPRTEKTEAQRGLKSLLAVDTRESYQGSGLSAPPLKQALGQGAHLVIREVLRQHPEGLAAKNIHQHAFMPSSRVKRLLSSLRGNAFEEKDGSEHIHKWLNAELGPERAAFHGAFDIPLDILATSELHQKRILGKAL